MLNKIYKLTVLCCVITAYITPCNTAAGLTEIEGNWRNIRQEGLDAVFISFGAGDSFYIDSQSHWYLGSYELETDNQSLRLILNVKDGSETESIGERFVYLYELDEEKLILGTSPNPGILDGYAANGQAVFITVNHDSDEDDDDDEFTLYASCFVKALEIK